MESASVLFSSVQAFSAIGYTEAFSILFPLFRRTAQEEMQGAPPLSSDDQSVDRQKALLFCSGFRSHLRERNCFSSVLAFKDIQEGNCFCSVQAFGPTPCSRGRPSRTGSFLRQEFRVRSCFDGISFGTNLLRNKSNLEEKTYPPTVFRHSVNNSGYRNGQHQKPSQKWE
jgi:hypothetical protein